MALLNINNRKIKLSPFFRPFFRYLDFRCLMLYGLLFFYYFGSLRLLKRKRKKLKAASDLILITPTPLARLFSFMNMTLNSSLQARAISMCLPVSARLYPATANTMVFILLQTLILLLTLYKTLCLSE